MKKTDLKIFVVPDTQVHEGVDTKHLTAAGNYIADHKPDVIIHVGDHWDMPSLNSYEKKGSKYFEGKSYKSDIDAGNRAIHLLEAPIEAEMRKAKRYKKKAWEPRKIFLMGNHEYRINRAINEDPTKLEGVIGLDQLELDGWETHPFREVIDLNGIRFSHYFCNPHSAIKSPLGGTIDNMLKNCGFSFVQGHTQGLKMGKHYLADGTTRLGIAAGSFYSHEEGYMGPQGNRHWRGCVMLSEVNNGTGDICELSLDYLVNKWL